MSRRRIVLLCAASLFIGGGIVGTMTACSVSAGGGNDITVQTVHTGRGDVTCAVLYRDQGISCDWEHPQ